MADNWESIANNLSSPGAVTSFSKTGISTGGSRSAQGYQQNITNNRFKYPHPSHDMTNTYMPKSIKEVLKYIATIAFTNPLVSQCISKLSEYPITRLVYNNNNSSEFKNDKLKEKWKKILERHIDIKAVMKQAGMDYHGYGMSVMSIKYPFIRRLKCPKCKETHSDSKAGVKFKNWEFHSKCDSCGYKGKGFIAEDRLSNNYSGISIVHWDLMNLEIKYNSITGDHFFYYTIPRHIKKELENGNMDFVKTTRKEVIEAAKKGSKLKLKESNLFFLKRIAPQYLYPSERGWGVSSVFSVMKDVFHNQILKKGNEMIAFDHIVPLRIMYPASQGEVSPHMTMDMSGWKQTVENEIKEWRQDPNRIMYAPLPVGMQQMGGDSRALMVTPEIKAIDDNIITGTGMIPEIIRGGASWSGSSVSLRIVENSYLNHRESLHELLEFIVDNISKVYNIPKIDVKMADFKMADDINRKKLVLEASKGSPASNHISKTSLIENLGFDPEQEYENKQEELKKSIDLLVSEKKGSAEAEGEASIINSIFQAEAKVQHENRLQSKQEESRTEQQKEEEMQDSQESQKVYEELLNIANELNVNTQNLNPGNILMKITKKMYKLKELDEDEFASQMLYIKNTFPGIYKNIYSNIKEMNTIKADATPDLDTAQKQTPGEIPVYTQGDTHANKQPNSIETTAEPNLPEQKPPQSNTPGV